ncbi:hypothetical protein SmJEL517_g05644 [Synchytrium microbalum]|uniref:RNA helicase n=1 Tax=Synchytrium microbalum TaxID=1806994 RepID=A0A507BUL0_9FUNG|nr:uncharacterized protein SmJEL517_g05644 [Synchytrium microbalum]TPX30901.1 hypothetical protein SmJEL517_g05644 [Synchytrium microbalum]
MTEPVTKIAVIGSGLAGLVTAHLLSEQDEFKVHLYEQAESLGMDAASITVGDSRIDVPMRSFFPGYYPRLTRLYDYLNIPYAASENSMSYLHLKHTQSQSAPLPQSYPSNINKPHRTTLYHDSIISQPRKPYFSFSTYRIQALDFMASLPDTPSSANSWTSYIIGCWTALLITWQFLYLVVAAKYALAMGHLLSYKPGQVNPKSPYKGMTLAEYFKVYRYSDAFVGDSFFPLFSGACTCTFEELSNFPAVVILEYVARCFPFGRMSFVTCGIQQVAERLAIPIVNNGRIHLSTPIASVTQTSTTGHRFLVETTSGSIEGYHHVIFATQANQAARMLGNSRDDEGWESNVEEQRMAQEWKSSRLTVLNRFPYQKSTVVCHTDTTLMPEQKADWRCLNFAKAYPSKLKKDAFKGIGYNPNDIAQCTHWANISQAGLSSDVFQTTNPIVLPDPSKTLSISWFERCYVTMDSMMAIDDLAKLQGQMAQDVARLEYLGLVSKITTELSNHTNIADKDTAEFLIAVHDASTDYESFKKQLGEAADELGDSFLKNVDRIIKTMRPLGAKSLAGPGMKMKKQKKNKGKAGTGGNAGNSVNAATTDAQPSQWEDDETAEVRKAQKAKFPGLSRPDDLDRVNKLIEEDVKVVDDTLKELQGLVSGSRREVDSRKRSSRSPSPNYNNHKRRRSNSPSDRKRRRSPSPNRIDDTPLLHKIYEGTVQGIKDFGAFVRLDGVRGRVDGMVHVSSMSNSRVGHASDVVSRNQRVKVKVMSVAGNRVGLSMKDVDQETGKDLTPHLRIKSAAEMAAEIGRNPDKPVRMAPDSNINSQQPVKKVKRLTSPERWEIKQLIASGVLDPKDYPTFDEETGLAGYEDKEEDLDIEVREDEPFFLKGQTKQSINLSPIKIVKNPDGTMNRAALSTASQAKERREAKRAEAAAEFDAVPRDLNRPWIDPMADAGERGFAQDMKGMTVEERVPEWKKKTFNNATTFGKITSLTIKEQREHLPIYKLRNALVQAVYDNQVLIVVGDTGSGKTTQMTQYLAEDGFTARGMIGCTQPRRVAAMSVAKRVAEEVGCRLGEEVGYTIRFEDCTSPATKIKYMTDGMLMRECLIDPMLNRYSVIMLDEAHERTIHTDVMFGLLKKTIKARPDLKIIVTSATLDAEKFSKYFFNCPIFSIPGRTYPVEILYTKDPESDYLDAALITTMQIHLSEPAGDILVFLTGQEEIDTAAEILFERMKALGPLVPELIVLPVYSALPSEMQSKIFEPAPPGSRKVVLATNIAETSITIDGIYYVIDPGFVKQNTYDPKLGMDALVVVPISQAQARQRSGRAGRTGPGKCYRLYTEAAYQNEMLPNSVPEIQRMNLGMTVLTLKAMGINDMLGFDFMDPPPVQTMVTAMELLYQLGALDTEGLLTKLGRKMAEFPLDPPLSKMLIVSEELGCSDEVLTIVSMLSVQNVFYRPKEKQAQADSKKAKFHQPEGDHLTLLAVYNGWKASQFSSPWCYENYIQARQMRRAQDVRKQLLGMLDRYHHDVVSCGRNVSSVVKAICSGFFRHAAKKDPQEGYKTLAEGTPVHVHPSSALFNKQPEWVIYHELVLTTKEYMREVTAVDPKWLVEVAPTFFKVGDVNRISKTKKNEKIEPLFNRYEAPNEWRISRLQRGTRASQTFG